MGAPYVLNVFKTNWAWTSQIPPREHPICATDSNESPKKWWNTNLNQEENKENSTKASLTTSRKEICDGFPCFYLDPWLVFHVGWKGLNKTCRRHRGPPPTPGRTPLRSPCWWWVSLQANPYPPLSRKITVEKNVARWMDGGWFGWGSPIGSMGLECSPTFGSWQCFVLEGETFLAGCSSSYQGVVFF